MNNESSCKKQSPRAAAFREKTLSGAKALARDELRLNNNVSETVGQCKAKKSSGPR